MSTAPGYLNKTWRWEEKFASKLWNLQEYYLLTPWCRVPLEKLTVLQLVKKFPAFHGTRRFITALTSVRHLSLSWANPTQSIYPHPTSWRSILILSTHIYYVSLFAVMLKESRKKKHNRRKNDKEIVRRKEKKHRRREWKEDKERWKETRKIGRARGG